jgi:hypothetical protein
MRANRSMVPSPGALLLTALLALVGCGAPNINPGADREDVGPTADASTADRAISEDRPAVLDAGSDADDASTPPDAAPADVTPPEDASPPDSGLPMCELGQVPTHDRPCQHRMAPTMMCAPFTHPEFCAPSLLNISSTMNPPERGQMNCREINGTTYADLAIFGPEFQGATPSAGDMFIQYVDATHASYGVRVVDGYRLEAVMWPAGTAPMNSTAVSMMGAPRITLVR